VKTHPTYLHPLDYPLGLKYYLTDESLPCTYTVTPETFIVEEIMDWDRLGFDESSGEYVVFRIVKSGLETIRAADLASRIIGVPKGNIVFMGLKDRDALATQYFFVKKSLVRRIPEEKALNGFTMEFYGYVARKPSRRYFIGNRFTLRIPGCSSVELASQLMREISHSGLPSYYGYQRFGARRPNTHILGYYILAGRLDLFIDELAWRPYPSEPLGVIYRRLSRSIDRRLHYEHLALTKGIEWFFTRYPGLKRLMIDAYQSYLYNLLLNKIIEEEGWAELDRDLPMPGCDPGYYEDRLKVRIPNRRLMGCWSRRGLFRPSSTSIEKQEDCLVIGFILRSGFYASIIMRELFKNNLNYT
jgi:tRNA pseudouridine13 synthase